MSATEDWGPVLAVSTPGLHLNGAAHGKDPLKNLFWTMCLLKGQCSDTPSGFCLLIRVNMQLSKQNPNPWISYSYFKEILYLAWPEDVILGFCKSKEGVSRGKKKHETC